MSEHSEHYHDTERNKPLPGANVSSKEEVLQTLLTAARGEITALAEANKLLAAQVAKKEDEILALHRRLAAETLRANQGWERYESANKDRNDIRAAQVAGNLPAEFNINDMMIVTLTEFGADIWNCRYADLPLPADLVPAPVDAGYVARDQMWSLMQTFGPHIGLGGKMPFLNAMMGHAKVSARAANAPSEPSELLFTADDLPKVFDAKRLMIDAMIASAMPYATIGVFSAKVNKLIKSRAADAPFEPTEISAQLREYAGNPGYSHGDYADTMRRAADALDSQPTESSRLTKAERGADLACETCHGTGQMCVGTSGQESDGNAPVMEPCAECGYGDEASSQPTDGEVRNG